MPVVALGAMQIAGTAMAIKGSMDAAKFNKDMAKYQSKMNLYRAGSAQRAGQEAATQEALRNRQKIASGQVAFASNGVLLDTAPTSAPNMWHQDQAAQDAYDTQVIMDNAQAQAWGFTKQSEVDKAQGLAAAHAGQMQAWSLGLGAVGMAAPAIAGGVSGGVSAYKQNSLAASSQTN